MKFHGMASRRHLLRSAAALGALWTAGSTALAGAVSRVAAAWPAARPPRPARIRNEITQLGRKRIDWYSWLKFIPEQGQRDLATMPPLLRDHLRAEQAYSSKMLAPLEARRRQLTDAMLARGAGQTAVPPLHATGQWAYFSEQPAGQKFPRYRRRAADGAIETLLDENARAAGMPYYRTTDHQHSPDHRYFAWAEDVVGNDRHRILVRDNRTGDVRTIVPADAYGYGGLVFSPASRWLFWIWRDARNRPRRLYRSAVDGSETVLVYEEADPAIFMQVARTVEGGMIAVTLSGPDTSEVRVVSGDDETAPARIIRPREQGVRYELEQWRGDTILLTDADGAFDRKLVRLNRDGAVGDVLVAHKPGREILAIHLFRDGLVRLERENVAKRVVILSPGGEERVVDFGTAPADLTLPTGQDYASPVCRLIYQSPRQPRQWFDVDLTSGERRLVGAEKPAGFDPAAYRVERLFATAPDGEQVPITLVARADTPRNGSAPLLIYGYGAYGISSDPEFSVPVSVLVDQGWVYAIAHVRGGSEKGRRWFLGGRAMTKRNSFTDFNACAEFLASRRYCAASRIVAYGLSAGGLLTGASMTIRPDLYAGVIAKVPFVDMLNTMSDASHPLVPLFRPDWGDPLADPRAYDYIASISPYENARPAAYPPLLTTAGLKDDRVGYWEPAKFVAAVRHASTSGNPAILKLDENSGHQGSGSDAEAFAEYALFWAFADHCVGGGDMAAQS